MDIINSPEDIGSLLSLPVRILGIRLVELANRRLERLVEGFEWISVFIQNPQLFPDQREYFRGFVLRNIYF